MFKKLGMIEPILQAIKDFEEPTEIQRKSIPLILSGKDVIAGSATGSGKTLAFGAGIIQNCEKGRGLQALILTPTRELAEQIRKELIRFSHYKPLFIVNVYGGVGIEPQIENLRKADVVVGTPGRVLDHIGRNTIDLRKIKIMVLDEADRMLDMGFIEDVEQIIRRCPRERQTLLFSATIPLDIEDLTRKYMRNPIKVSAVAMVDPTKLRQVYYDIPENIKFSLLVHLLKHEEKDLVMVFCNSRKTVDFVANNLKINGVKSQAIHGGFSQAKRSRTMDDFHKQNIRVLVCTDVAARGLDIYGVSHVYNYDIPKESKQYIHRIGRTARAGKEGKAINLLCRKDFDNFSRVLRDYAVDVTKEETPKVERANIRWKDKGGFGRGDRGFGRGPRRGGHGGHRRFGRGSRRFGRDQDHKRGPDRRPGWNRRE